MRTTSPGLALTRHNSAAVRLLGRALLLSVVACLCTPAAAQQVQILNMEIVRDENGFLVKGKVQGSGLNPQGQIVEQDYVAIVADIQKGPGAVYPVLPDGMYCCPLPEGAKSAYTKGDGTLTPEEVSGTNITTVRISAFHLRNATVWYAYGGVPDWVKNAPATVTADFEGRIPLEHAGKQYRIRAVLDHRWGGPRAWWSACSLHHHVAEEGTLGAGSTTKPHEIKITFGPTSSSNPAWPGQKVECIVQAQDSQGHELKYEWRALGGTVGFDDPSLKRPTWTVQPNNTDHVVAWTISVRVYCDHGASAEGHFMQQVQPGYEVLEGLKPITERYEKLEHGYFEDQSLFGIFPPGASNNIMQAFFDWGKYAPVFWPAFDAMEANASDLERFTCGGCQGRVLDMLDDMRLNGTPAEQEAMKHWDYGPLRVLPTMHQVVVIWPKGGGWRTDGIILDPWPNQRPESKPIGQFMTGQLTNVHAMPSVFYSGMYPLTGGSKYPEKYEGKVEFTERHRRIQGLLTQEQLAGLRSKATKKDRIEYLEGVGAALEKQNPNALRTAVVATKSPVRMLLTDGLGRRAGWADAETLVNEIPGTEIDLFPEPDGSEGMLVMMPLAPYRVTVTGCRTGKFGLLRVMAEQFTTAALAHAQDIPVAPGQSFEYIFSPDAPMAPLLGQGGATYPFVDVLIGGPQTGLPHQELTPVADADVYAYSYRNWNKANSGSAVTITAGYHPQGGEKRVYMRFELPEVQRVEKAVLRLYQYYAGGQPYHRLGVFRVTAPWQEGTGTSHYGQDEPTAKSGEISWVNQPTFDPDPVIAFQPPETSNTRIGIDITGLVNQWLAGTPNYGLVLKVADPPNPNMPNSWYGFMSRECEESAKRPVLELTTAAAATGGTGGGGQPATPETPATTGSLPATLADRVIRRAAICEGADADNLPLLRTDFPVGTDKVGIYMEWVNGPANTQVRVQWYCNGQALHDTRIVAEGTRKIITYLRHGIRDNALPPGHYQAAIFRDDKPVTTLTFNIRVTR